MFANVSMTSTGVIALFLATVLKYLGIESDQSVIESALVGLITFVGWAFTVWGSIRRTDLYLGLFRK